MSVRFPNMGLEFDYIPRSIRIFGFEITFFGILLALGLLLGMAFVVLEAKRRKKNPNEYIGMVIAGILGGFVGARLFYVAFSWSLYKTDIMKIFDTRSGGMVFYGGLFGGILAVALYCCLKKLPFMEMADTASMGLLIGQIIGRWGNFFNRECFGEYTSNILTMQLPVNSVRASEVTPWMRENLVSLNGTSYIQVTPLFLYESIWCLVLLLVLLAQSRRKRFQGEIFMRYLAGYGFGRFFIELLRTDKILWPGTDIAVCQVISAVLFVYFGLAVIIKRIMAKKRAAIRKRRREKNYEEEERAEAAREQAEKETPEEAVRAIEAGYSGKSSEEALDFQKEPPVPEDTKAAKADGQPDTDPGGSAEKSPDQPEA